MKLVIPIINLDIVINEMGSELNNVDYNVEMLSDSDIDRNVYFFAGHSGQGDNCYFNRVKELKSKDLVYLYCDSKVLVYEVMECFYIVKDGYMEVDNELEDILYLITCSDYDRQLVIKCTLIN